MFSFFVSLFLIAYVVVRSRLGLWWNLLSLPMNCSSSSFSLHLVRMTTRKLFFCSRLPLLVLFTGMQSLRMKLFFNSREWYVKDNLQILLITRSHCNGMIGLTFVSPSGSDQFCVKDSYTIASYWNSQVHVLTYYCHIQVGPKSINRFFVTPKLPNFELGGPVTGLFKARYREPTHPKFLWLTIEQFNCLFILCN